MAGITDADDLVHMVGGGPIEHQACASRDFGESAGLATLPR
jgi:hypothetical protein